MRIVTLLVAIAFAASTSTLALAKGKHKTHHRAAATTAVEAPVDPNAGGAKLIHDFFSGK